MHFSDYIKANAFYNPQNNSINIMAGFLIGDLYNEEMSEAQLLGAVGATIGHEISHAFLSPSEIQYIRISAMRLDLYVTEKGWSQTAGNLFPAADSSPKYQSSISFSSTSIVSSHTGTFSTY